MNNCPNCGANVNSGEAFCKVCGTKIAMSQNNFFNSTQQFQQVNTQGINSQQQIVNTNLQFTNNNSSINNGVYKLTLTRPKLFVGSLWTLKIYIDGKKKCELKNGESIKLDITGGNHHISFSGYSDYTLQVLDDVTANVVITDTKKILLQDLIGANIITDENNPYNTKALNISDFVMISSIILLIPSLFFSMFISDITILLLIIVLDIIFALIGIISTKKQQSKLGYSFKKVMTSYIGTIIINVINIMVCIIIKSF